MSPFTGVDAVGFRAFVNGVLASAKAPSRVIANLQRSTMQIQGDLAGGKSDRPTHPFRSVEAPDLADASTAATAAMARLSTQWAKVKGICHARSGHDALESFVATPLWRLAGSAGGGIKNKKREVGGN